MKKQDLIKNIKGLIKDKEGMLEGDELDRYYEYDIELLKSVLKAIEEKPKGVWVATMDSESFEWKSVGRTRAEAINAIATEWNKDSRRVTMTRKELEDYYGINCEFLEYGKCEWR